MFDIDGTLLLSGGAGCRALEQAIEGITGKSGGMNDVLPDGKTDYLIVEEAFRVNFPEMNLGWREIEDTLCKYLTLLPKEISASKGFRLMPGVPDLLDACRERPQTLLGIATGNLEKGAEIKLRHAGLWEYFSFGGYGSDAIERVDLVRVAVQRAQTIAGGSIPLQQIYVIGDTPYDILCAQGAGVRSIGVGAAHFSCRELATYHPDFLLENLSDISGFLECLK